MKESHPTRHSHRHHTGARGWIEQAFHLHAHAYTPAARTDPLLATQEGIRTVWIALVLLAVTTVLQVGIVFISGSVALFADTIHNFGDALNSIPLLIAFYVARRAATRRYTYGFGRAEDVAGVIIVLSMMVSAGVILWESLQKLIDPQPMTQLPWVIAAAIVGFMGNEGVAWLQIRVGRKINSEAMIADGMHARTDGLTSLAVVVAAIGSALGFPILDPIIGLLIGITIIFITKDATMRIWYRLMDAVDPSLITRIEELAGERADVRTVQARWVGHELYATIEIAVPQTATSADTRALITQIQQTVQSHLTSSVTVAVLTAPPLAPQTMTLQQHQTGGTAILPPRYRGNTTVSAAPMGAASLQYDTDGNVAWDEIWTGYCELALAGGPPHRGNLLEPVAPQVIADAPDQYANVQAELERGLTMVTGVPIVQSATPGWIGIECTSEEMALWLLRAIVVENVSVRREGRVLFFPVSPYFRLEHEIKSIITVTAKTTHYWNEHAQAGMSISGISQAQES